ncbi:MAG: aminoglycoside phosphotransferase family protein [Chloroflexi bacterium]|nr:aminoglycoside phosphotransferase family protein [Chloroflexota bacterium]
MDKLIEIAEQFNTNGPVLSVREYGTGNVNDTFLVTLHAVPQTYFIMQRINQRVFHRPELIMVNMRALSEHVRMRLAGERNGHAVERRWEMPRVFETLGGKSYFVDADNSFWRAMSFIDHSTAFPRIQGAEHAREAGYALGRFQSLISDMDISKLHDTLVGFHITPCYLQHYDEVLGRKRDGRDGADSPEETYCKRFVAQRRKSATVLEDAKGMGKLRLRPMHGDPKIDNIMIDDVTRQAIGIIDLDTVKPGLVHYDIGDCLRSCCNLLGEETTDFGAVRFETDLCREILRGYLTVVGSFFDESDYAYLYDAVRLIAFELGLRFFTDHLEGNVYFKARYKEHNLHRAMVQFKLMESIEASEADIRKIVADLK